MIKNKKTGEEILLLTAVAIILLAIDFLLTAGLLKIMFWAFDWSWSWKISIGIWTFQLLILSFFRAVKYTNDK